MKKAHKCNSLKAAATPLPTFSTSNFILILKYQPVLAFCHKREIMLLSSIITTSEQDLQRYSNQDVRRQDWSDHLSSLQQSQAIACSG